MNDKQTEIYDLIKLLDKCVLSLSSSQSASYGGVSIRLVTETTAGAIAQAITETKGVLIKILAEK